MKTSTFLLFFSFTLILSAQNSAVYDITFTSTWNATEHSSIPSGAHWSRLVGATHKTNNAYLELGSLATTGIKDVAELGQNSALMTEVQNSSYTKEWFNQSMSPYGAIGSATLQNVEFTLEHSLITLVTMIAPSPDWFMAINSLSLRNDTNTAWKDSFSFDVFVYDAGTDNGTNYNSSDSPNTPTVITKINGFPFFGIKVGTVTVTQKSLSTPEFNINIQKINMYPNPVVNGKVTIDLPTDVSLKSIEIYNLLGKRVKQNTDISSSNIFLNVSDLNSGIYLVKFNTDTSVTTRKLIIK